MTFEKFGEIVERRLGIIGNVLGKKGRHYNRGEERFHNFKRGGEIAGVSPERALWGYLTKHLISVLDIIDGQVPLSQELIDEKIGDCINYFFLLEGLLTERLGIEECKPAAALSIRVPRGTTAEQLEQAIRTGVFQDALLKAGIPVDETSVEVIS